MKKVGVVGCGLMGSGIAEISARAGLDVIVIEGDLALLAKGRERIQGSLAKARSSVKISEAQSEALLSNIQFSTDFSSLADREIVIEAVTEAEEEKVKVLRLIDSVVESETAIFASNTSSIPITRLAMATKRPQSVVGLHFFNPVPILPLVELVLTLLTSVETEERAYCFASDVLGKRVIRSKDRSGFIVNALLVPYLLSAIRMAESGFATAEDIDRGMVDGCAHPMGPLALVDLIGLDTTMAVAQSLYREFKEPLYAPPPLLSRMCEAGLLGRKTGKGFYDYL